MTGSHQMPQPITETRRGNIQISTVPQPLSAPRPGASAAAAGRRCNQIRASSSDGRSQDARVVRSLRSAVPPFLTHIRVPPCVASPCYEAGLDKMRDLSFTIAASKARICLPRGSISAGVSVMAAWTRHHHPGRAANGAASDYLCLQDGPQKLQVCVCRRVLPGRRSTTHGFQGRRAADSKFSLYDEMVREPRLGIPKRPLKEQWRPSAQVDRTWEERELCAYVGEI